MSALQTNGSYDNEDDMKMLNYYTQNLYKIKRQHDEFLSSRKFSFINAINRDFLTRGGGRILVRNVNILQELYHNLCNISHHSKVDSDVVGIWLAIYQSIVTTLDGFVQLASKAVPFMSSTEKASASRILIENLRRLFRTDYELSQLHHFIQVYHLNKVNFLKYTIDRILFVSFETFINFSGNKKVPLNDAEAIQFSGLFNLIPYMYTKAGELSSILIHHFQEVKKQKRDALQKEQYLKPISPPSPIAQNAPVSENFSQTDVRIESVKHQNSSTQLDAADWRKMQLEEKDRNLVKGHGVNFPPFATTFGSGHNY